MAQFRHLTFLMHTDALTSKAQSTELVSEVLFIYFSQGTFFFPLLFRFLNLLESVANGHSRNCLLEL